MNVRVVGNRYEMGERLGGGGMAVVYRARDLQTGRDVALKVLRGQPGTDDEFIRRFRREAQNAAGLSHPNIVQIYDVGIDEDTYYIVLEYVRGRSLKEMIQQQGPLPAAEACRIAIEICTALMHAHQSGIVHRDIKPHNILVSKDGHVKVTDFGIARATTTDTVTHTGSIMGSAHYFSPEQADGKVTGEKSDLYSLGCVLYELVTGTVPFQGESPITVAIKHIREQALRPSRLNGEIPQELDEIIMRALEKEPEDRYGSADDMRNALAGFLVLHEAGETHIASGDFPTMDMRSLRTRKFQRDELDGGASPRRSESRRPESRRTVEPEPERRRSYGWIWVLVIAGMVFGAIGFGVVRVMEFLNVPTLKVPDVVGLPLIEAEKLLRDAGLSHKTQSQQYSDFKVNTVIATEPVSGTDVKPNRVVELTVSLGPESSILEDLRGQTREQAEIILENQGFVVGKVDERVDNTVDRGRVIESLPREGTAVRAGAPVNLVVSLGPLRVPALIGLTLDQARQQLEAVGLAVGQPTYQAGQGRPRNTVLATDPPSGTKIEKGKAVNLILSEGANPAQAKPFKRELTVPANAGSPNATFVEFRVALFDRINDVPQERDLVAGRYRIGEKVTVEGVYYHDDAILRVIVDGREVTRITLKPSSP